MNRIISLVLLVGGIVLLVFAANASDSVGSSVSRALTGNPTDRTLWLLIGGLVATIAGGTGLIRGAKTR